MPDEASRSGDDSGSAVRGTRVVVRSTDEFREWVATFAQRERSTAADLIERAIVSYARATRFQVDPPPR